MAASKVVYGNRTLIDLTGDTVEAETLLDGYTAHQKNGETATGTLGQYGMILMDENGDFYTLEEE